MALHTELNGIYAVLDSTPLRWQSVLTTFSLETLQRQPAAGEWSALNCLQHLLDTERRLYPVRVQAFLREEPFVDFDPLQYLGEYADLSLEALIAQFARIRQESLALLTGLRTEDLARTAQHPKLGTVTLIEMLNTWAAHDVMHTVQGERALMQPLIQACGPWRPFFQDHGAAAPSH